MTTPETSEVSFDRRSRARPGRISGRDAERATIELLAQRHRLGHGAIVAINGEAGIGKTTLLGLLADTIRVNGGEVVWIACTEAEQIRPFGALLDVLDCRLNHPDPLRRRVAEAVVEATDLAIDPFRLDSDSVWRLPVQEAIVDLLIELIEQAPTLLAIDDLQWADAGTNGVVSAIARRTQSSSLLLAWTRRSSVSSAVADHIVARFREEVTDLTLGSLDADTIRQIGADLLGHAPDRVQSLRLNEAQGNPFFVSALLAHDDGTTRTDALRRWIERLPASTGTVLTTAALLGLEFDVKVLASVTRSATVEILDELEPAVRAGVINATGSGRYVFAHDLLRSVVEAGLPPTLGAALHREIAGVLERSGADVGVVAQHLARGARKGDEETAARIRSACSIVVRTNAASASDLLGRAASLCRPGSRVWAEIMADRVTALQWAGRAPESLQLAEEAIAHDMDPEHRSRLRMVRATSLAFVNDLPGAAVEYRSVADDRATPPELRSLVLAELATIEAWGTDRAKGRADALEALTLAREINMMQAELQSLCALSTMSLFDGEVHEAVSIGREAVTRGQSHKSISPAREVYLALALANADEHDEAAYWYRKGQQDAERVGDLWLVSRYQLARISSDVLTGAWESVTADAEAVIALHEDTGLGSGMPQAPGAAGVVAVRRRADESTIARYRELSTKHANAGAELPGLLFHAWFESLLAEREGRLADAAAILGFAYDTVIGNARLVQVWLAPDVVRVFLAAGDVDGASRVADDMTRFAADVVKAPSAHGTAALCRGLVALCRQADGASELLMAAAQSLRVARRYPALLQALEALPPTPAIVAECVELRDRLGIAAESSASPTTSLMPSPTTSLMTSTASSTTGAAPSVLSRLTATEESVAKLVAEGLSNPSIAVRMGLSKRTVEYHMSFVYAKLGVNSRVAVANLVGAAERI